MTHEEFIDKRVAGPNMKEDNSDTLEEPCCSRGLGLVHGAPARSLTPEI